MRTLAIALLLVACAGGTDPNDTASNSDPEVPTGDFYGMDLARGAFATAITASDYTCGGSADTTCDDSACDTNTAPVLGTPILVVNGYESTTYAMGDHVQVIVPFEDADCNLGCGGIAYGYGTPDLALDADGGSCDDQPCSTADSGVYVGVGLGTLDRAGEYYAHIQISDACNATSNRAEIDFSL